MSFPGVGEKVVLEYTKEAKHRVICGIGWDPKTEDGNIKDKLNDMRGINTYTYDLDLSCFMFDEEGNFMGSVTGEDGATIDASGKIYHSGDSVDGEGDGDDEDLSVELADIPDHIQQVIFVVDIGSAHSFNDVLDPEIRLFDAFSNKEMLKSELSLGRNGEMTACVFAKIYRDKNGQWMLHNISHFLDLNDIEDWSQYLYQFCEKNVE